MAKLLNLDSFEKENRVLRIGGTEYPIKEISVGVFMEVARLAETLDQNDYMKQFEAMLEFLAKTVPTLPAEVAGSLTPEQLSIVVAFIRGEYDVEESPEEIGKKKPKSVAKK